jgi:GT2 family glycosyltransferase
VLNWNNYIDTRECIESLRQSSYPLEKIILIDNASQDGSIELLQKEYGKSVDIHIIRNNANYGFAGGVNVGIRYALKQGAKLIFLVNNDAIVDVSCIKNLYTAMKESSNIGIAGPRIFYYKESKRIWHGGGFFNWFKTGMVVPEKDKLVEECETKTKEVTFLTGCAMLIKREVFETIGLFDEDFFLYGEDMDFCLRAFKARFKLLYVPSAKVWHKIETVAKSRTAPFILYHMARSRILWLRKNFSWLYFLYGLLVHLLLYTPFRFLQIIQGSRSLESMWAWLRGTWAGLICKIST